MMALERSEKSKYQSPSTGDFCTCAQYLGELLCRRQAEKKNVGALAYKFWSTPKWKNVYVRQVAAINKLINEYGEDPVFKFFTAEENKWINSTGWSGVKDGIKDMKELLDSRAATPINFSSAITVADPTEKPRPTQAKKTMFGALKNKQTKENNGEST